MNFTSSLQYFRTFWNNNLLISRCHYNFIIYRYEILLFCAAAKYSFNLRMFEAYCVHLIHFRQNLFMYSLVKVCVRRQQNIYKDMQGHKRLPRSINHCDIGLQRNNSLYLLHLWCIRMFLHHKKCKRFDHLFLTIFRKCNGHCYL